MLVSGTCCADVGRGGSTIHLVEVVTTYRIAAGLGPGSGCRLDSEYAVMDGHESLHSIPAVSLCVRVGLYDPRSTVVVSKVYRVPSAA